MPFFRATSLMIVFVLTWLAIGVQASTAITYQGQLQDGSGPFSDQVEMIFRLYDSKTGTNQIGPELGPTAVQVNDGLFQVELDFGNVYAGPRWLEVEVDGSILTPRQRFAPVPVALRSKGLGAFAASEPCEANSDCESGRCSNGFCVAPTCTDGLQNGPETGVDCGGPNCIPCPSGQSCEADGDCDSGVCVSRSCQAPSCSDGTLNGSESSVDCGGQDCAPCPAGQSCGASQDCNSGVCVAGSCREPTCSDAVRNGNESDTDCGGPVCAPCSAGSTCNRETDCQSGVCSGSCQAPSCTDRVRNGDESDIDCGGSCSDCPSGLLCNSNSDCASGSCTNGRCA